MVSGTTNGHLSSLGVQKDDVQLGCRLFVFGSVIAEC